MTNIKQSIVIITATLMLFVGVAYGGDLEDGMEAYENGDYGTASTYFRKAAEQGDADAQYFLGWMYDNGEGVTQNDKEAVKWYLKAAEQGDAKAQNSLGMMYRNGTGVTQFWRVYYYLP